MKFLKGCAWGLLLAASFVALAYVIITMFMILIGTIGEAGAVLATLIVCFFVWVLLKITEEKS